MKKILVVEDDHDVRKSIVEILKNAGYSVVPAIDGQQAIDYLRINIPDLVLSDIMMPRADGYKVLEFLRSNPITESIPFVFLSAKAEYSEIRKGMGNGADDYLFKPFRAKELINAIEVRLAKKEKVYQKFEQIYSNISCSIPHELLTPIIPILGYPEVLSENIENYSKEEILRILGLIKQSGNRLHKSVKRFLRFLEIKKKVLDKNNSSVAGENSDVVSIVKANCENFLAEHNRKEDVFYELDEAEVSITPYDLEFVINEIIANAVNFSDAGTPITVTGKIIRDNYSLSVSDNGCGMNQGRVNEILPLLQHEGSKYERQGFGLGLVTIKKIMEYYDGKLKIKSALNEGTTCTVLIPLSIPEQVNSFDNLSDKQSG